MILNRIFWNLILILFVALPSYEAAAQYDTLHYIPPFYSRSPDAANVGNHYLFLSTNSVTPFDVTVVEADGTPIAVVSISLTNEAQIDLGVSYAAVGIVDQSGINTPLANEGIIATASTPFFANIRHSAGSQGASLTSKGTWAKGTRFRSGHLYSIESTTSDGPLKVHIISVMATEDNTSVTFSDINPGVIFNGTPVTGNTSDDITVVLNQHESYIIAAHIDEPLATGNDTIVNGVLVESSAPIVMNSGSWCGGSNLTQAAASRDIGIDQIVPTSLLGKEHIVVKRYSYLEDECEKVIVISDQDNNEIFLNGSATPYVTLNQGETFIIPASEYDMNDIMYIESTKEVYVYQSTNGSATVSHAQGLNFIPPLACSGIKEVTVPTIDSFDGIPAGIDIIAKVGSVVLMDGGPLGVAPIPVTGNSEWEVYKLTNMVGTVNFVSDDNINVAMIANSGARGAAGYFSGFSRFAAEIEAQSANGDTVVVEGCTEGEFIITKPEDLLDEDVTFYFEIDGTAINGIDYGLIPDSMVVPAGIIEDTLWITPLYDDTTEQVEYIILTIINNTACDTIVIVDTLYILNYEDPVLIDLALDQLICTQTGESANLFIDIDQGIGPYSYVWSPFLADAPTVNVSPEVMTEYFVTATDACGNSVSGGPITVHNHCMPAAPNVITPNGDLVNDYLAFQNLEQYPGSRLLVTNRWGNVVYESEDYLNDWDGDNLSEGVYFFRLFIEYNPNIGITYFEETNEFNGFFHIVR